jgi:hypothetical protein
MLTRKKIEQDQDSKDRKRRESKERDLRFSRFGRLGFECAMRRRRRGIGERKRRRKDIR